MYVKKAPFTAIKFTDRVTVKLCSINQRDQDNQSATGELQGVIRVDIDIMPSRWSKTRCGKQVGRLVLVIFVEHVLSLSA